MVDVSFLTTMKATSLELSPMLTQMPGGAEAALGIQWQGLKLGVEPEMIKGKGKLSYLGKGKGCWAVGNFSYP